MQIRQVIFFVLLTALALGGGTALYGQGTRQIKVVVQFDQSGVSSNQDVTGSGGVVITRRGGAQPSGRLTAQERQTTVQRSTGIFTLVQDGGESILTVATRVPQRQVFFFYDYLTGAGYIAKTIYFQEVGSSLRVNATILPGNQVNVRLTPRISYFSAERAGAIDVTEAVTELVVPHGQPVSLGGMTSQMHEVTRQILGFGDRSATSETSLVLTATIQ
jgi:hypothetical protein